MKVSWWNCCIIWINMNWSYVWNIFWPKCAPASTFEIINDSVERSHLEKRLSAELISTIIYQEMKPTLSACNSNRFSTLATVHIHICILRRSHLGQSASQSQNAKNRAHWVCQNTKNSTHWELFFSKLHYNK